jgi:hypothetical protein
MKYTLNAICCLFLLCGSLFAQTPPYSGTIFIDPDIITASDSSALESTSYIGQGMRTVYDRRVNNWVTINAYLFNVIWNDGLTSEAVINPEFGSIAVAMIEAEKYGFLIGQLPYCLRVDVDQIWVHQGVEAYGGGNKSILIHTGQSLLYEADGIIEETLVHEASHTSLDLAHSAAPAWLAAQNLDINFISTYARDNPDREDIAETYLTWLMVRHRAADISAVDFNKITQAIPNRLAYFDSMTCDLFPFVSGTVALNETSNTAELALVYPSPSTGFIHVGGVHTPFNYLIYHTLGALAQQGLCTNGVIDVQNLPSGLYFLWLENGMAMRFVRE